MIEIVRTVRCFLPLLGFFLFVTLWLGGTVLCVTSTEGIESGGGVVLGGLLFCLGYGFLQEMRRTL